MANKTKSENTESKRASNPLPEEPGERFKELVRRRGTNAVKIVRSLAVMGTQYGDKKGKYLYTEAEVNAFCNVLRSEVNDLRDGLIAAIRSDNTTGEKAVDFFAAPAEDDAPENTDADGGDAETAPAE